MIEFIKPEFIHSDNRGELKQLVSKGWQQINFISSYKGSFRGYHYHKNNREMFYVISGKFILCLELNDQKTTYLIEKDMFFIIEPLVSHSFEFLEDTLLIALYDNGVEEEEQKDIYSGVFKYS